MFEAIITEGDDMIILVFQYQADFIEELKQIVPHFDRTWDPEEKQWTIKASYLEAVLATAVDHWPRETYRVVTFAGDDGMGKTTRTNVVTGHVTTI